MLTLPPIRTDTAPAVLMRGVFYLAPDQPVHHAADTAELLRRELWRVARQQRAEPSPWAWSWKHWRSN